MLTASLRSESTKCEELVQHVTQLLQNDLPRLEFELAKTRNDLQEKTSALAAATHAETQRSAQIVEMQKSIAVLQLAKDKCVLDSMKEVAEAREQAQAAQTRLGEVTAKVSVLESDTQSAAVRRAAATQSLTSQLALKRMRFQEMVTSLGISRANENAQRVAAMTE